jgi:hypothetical protein
VTSRDAWLAAHIAVGFVALGAAPIAMLVSKGGKTHRRFGKIYFWSMLFVALSAIVLVVAFKSPSWLGMLAIFAAYLALSGYRVLYRKRPSDPPTAIDFGISLFGLASGVTLIGWASWRSWAGARGPFPIIAMVLGATAVWLAGKELRAFFSPSRDRRAWWFRHMQSMLAAYIATVTAFSATNFRFLPPLLRWLWPLVLGTVGITAWVTYYKLRFKSGAPVALSETESKIA